MIRRLGDIVRGRPSRSDDDAPVIDAAARRHAPATARNRAAILGVLDTVLPAHADVLEIAAGSGEHAVYFAEWLPSVVWQPTDSDPENVASIRAWAAPAQLPNLRPAVRLDVTETPWPGILEGSFDAVVCINLIHIAPWPVCEALMRGAGCVLKTGGLLYLYGPFRIDGKHTAPSNAAFDDSLKAMDPAFGVRDVGEVTAEAEANGLGADIRVEMPANNLSVVFRKR